MTRLLNQLTWLCALFPAYDNQCPSTREVIRGTTRPDGGGQSALSMATAIPVTGALDIRPRRLAQASASTLAHRKFLSLGEVGYKSLCFACHGAEGRGAPAPPRLWPDRQTDDRRPFVCPLRTSGC